MKVLDLGVGTGNPLSFELAANCKQYVALDLSESRIKLFSEKLEERGIEGVRLYSEDFLGDKFDEGDFDLVYALAIFHHFKHIDIFLGRVDKG